MSEFDPYHPPSNGSSSQLSDQPALRELVVGWERQRIHYNLILLPFGCGTLFIWSGIESYLTPLLVGAFLFAGGANLAYFLGPLVELYGRALLWNSKKALPLRQLLYWGEVGFSVLVIGACALSGVVFSSFVGI